ncbi:MAG: SDR family oxidoreductase [Bacteroidetes bacterium]|nr:SDR family oxidoreductase [Bacteroidota bacterium]
MKILLTGATGYIGQRLLPVLLKQGHEVICCVRDKARFNKNKFPSGNLQVIEIDFLDSKTLEKIPEDIDAAYFLVHSMATIHEDFENLEKINADNFKSGIEKTRAKQVIYLSGIVNEQNLSKHLRSRKKVEEILSGGTYSLTTLRAGIIIGSGSSSFEIMRDLVEKLPVMIAPRWLATKSQPIAIGNVIEFLKGVLMNEITFNRSFDIGGPDILTYKEMLLRFAGIRNLKRHIITVPVMTPRLSSYWLYFVTATSFSLAKNLVDSMKVEVICRENELKDLLGITLISYDDSIRLAFDKIEHREVLSSWTDALSSHILEKGVSGLIEVPVHGCFTDRRERKIKNTDATLKRIWAVGGKNGWYYANWLWELRGFIDKLFGGVGLRRGRKSSTEISPGDALDFWRVLLASKEDKRLLLYAEMKLPGEAWLEFLIIDNKVFQTATFRPLGLLGRLYWYSMLPFHAFIFRGMLKNIAS